MAYYSIEPWGPERADLGFGIVASTLANIHRDPKKGDPYTPSDFMAKYGQPEESDEAEEDDGLAPEKIMAAMERLRRHQEKVERQRKRA